MDRKNSDIYRYSTYVLATALLCIGIAFTFYNLGRQSIRFTTIPLTVTTQTSTQTTISNMQCSTGYTFISIGNTLSCGPFTAKVAFLNATNATFQIYYNDVYVNQSIFGGNQQKPFNFGNATFWIYMVGTVPSKQEVYFGISTGYVTCTTVIVPSSSSTSIVR